MTITKLLKNNLVLPKLSCSSRDELISKLLEHIYKTDRKLPLSANELRDKILMREKIGGTLLPSGLSIPHARIEDYEDFILAVGTPAEPLFHDGIQIRLMAMMISSQSGGAYYLTTLAAFTKLSRDAVYFSRLGDAASPEDFLKILEERDIELV